MDFRIVLKVIGGLLIILSALLCVPAIYGLFTEENHFISEVFVFTAFLCVILGCTLWFIFRNYIEEVNHRTGFAVVTFSWVTAGLIGAFPYWISGQVPSFCDAWFESMSGFSGTGASILAEIERVNACLLLWRSMTQWLGGMGIIVFFIAILPILGVGGVQLFRAETTGPQKDKITPRVREAAKNLWLLYVGFTALLAICLKLAGMSGYDAVNHALTTLSTGGFSTKNTGIAHFNSATIDYLICFFMFVGSINFALHYRLLVLKDIRSLLDTEFKSYTFIIILMLVLLTFCFWLAGKDLTEASFRATLFTTLATISSTGFTHYDYLTWPVACHFLLILLMVMGGMSGSTAGGCKCIRMVAAFKLLSKELRQVIHPHAMLSVKSNDRSIKTPVATAIWGFLFIYLWFFSVLAFVLMLDGLDLVSASTAVFSCLSNIGPAFGEFGPYDNYGSLADFSKFALTLGMVAGRLEFFTVLVLFTMDYWRK